MPLSARAIAYIFAVIFIEGYIVLSTELLAIRTLVPYVGNGTDTISIIIAAVLLPLAAGYFSGGKFRPSLKGAPWNKTIRRKLSQNILVATAIILAGLSFLPSIIIIESIIKTVSTDRLVVTSLFSAVFLVIPVYLLGQTTPLLSNFFSKEKLSEVTGKILFISTLGSFVGATFTTLFLMATIGVHNTVLVNIVLASLLYLSLNFKFDQQKTLVGAGVLIITAIGMNSGSLIERLGIVENNTYNLIAIKTFPQSDDFKHETKTLILNNTISSGIDTEGKPFEYIQYVDDHFIKTVPESKKPIEILVIGAGAFTVGLDDLTNNYDFIDIDASLKPIAEKYILESPLPENKKFEATPARGFLSSSDKKYDLILIDVYFGLYNVPEHLVTQDFLEQVRSALKPGGIITANFIVDSMMRDKFSANLDETFRSVFPNTRAQIVSEDLKPWTEESNPEFTNKVNMIYFSSNPTEDDFHRQIYTDDLNASYKDRPRSLR
ncbi:MAG TPA: fused MFS/spermidine synthase [Alphaproteobacteria bacterium]|nr:fused MFS/spermidine synthase [Alphaproteobacteria bacterium]HOO50653.1 fused MFS/spermidine synthase [Alphaproteobacteria bacterium]